MKFFQDNVLVAARPKEDKGLGREVTLREAINSAESKIETSFKDRPLIEASLRRVLGTTYSNLSEPNLAIQQLERSQALFKEHRGPDHTDTFWATRELGVAYWKARRTTQVVQLCEDLVPRTEAMYGPSRANTIEAKNLLAIAYRISGDTTKGVALHEQLFELAKANRGARDSLTLTLMNNVADGYIELKRYGDAIRLLEECVELGQAESSGAAADRRHAWHIEKLATTYLRVNEFDKAIRLSEEAWQHQKSKLGPTDITTLQSQTHLGWVYARAGKSDAAKMHFDQVLATLRSVITEPDRENPAVLQSIPMRIADALIEQKQYAEAESLLREFLTIGGQTKTPHLLGLALLGQAHGLQPSDPSAAERKLAEAEQFLVASYESLNAPVFPETDRELHLSNFNRDLTDTLQQLVDLYTTWNKAEDAAKWQKELDAIREDQPR